MYQLRLIVSGKNVSDLRMKAQAALEEMMEEDGGSSMTVEQADAAIAKHIDKHVAVSGKIPDHALQDPSLDVFKSAPITPSPEPLVKTMEIPNVAPVAQPSGPAPTVDSRGIKWDARVHSSTRELTDKGTWRRRRGVTPEQMMQAEMQQGLTTPMQATPAPSVAAPAIPPAPVAPTQEVVYQSPVYQNGKPVETPAPAPVVAPVKSYENIPIPDGSYRKPAHDIASFRATLIPTLAKLINDKKLNQDYLNELKSYFGVAEIWQVNDAQLTEMFNTFGEQGLITRVGMN